ncbi:MAG: hypothetical protein WBB74_02525 [Gaiellaceae bacterium]
MAGDALGADPGGMEPLPVECLRCGEQRTLEPVHRDAGECSRCAYVGWAPSSKLDEKIRKVLRHRPPERRHLYVA